MSQYDIIVKSAFFLHPASLVTHCFFVCSLVQCVYTMWCLLFLSSVIFRCVSITVYLFVYFVFLTMAFRQQGPSSGLNQNITNSDDEFEVSSPDTDHTGSVSNSSSGPDHDVSPPVWSANTQGMQPLSSDKINGLLVPIPASHKPTEFFNMLLDDEFWKVLCGIHFGGTFFKLERHYCG